MRVRWICGPRLVNGVWRNHGEEWDADDMSATQLCDQGLVVKVQTPPPPVIERSRAKVTRIFQQDEKEND